MKTNLFARLVSNFLTKHLPNVKGCSGNTIESYEDTFKLMLRFCVSKKQVQPESMTIELFHKDLVLAFLLWLEVERNCIISTRNQRLSTLKSFAKYVLSEQPSYLMQMTEIISIPLKKSPKSMVDYLEVEQLKLLLSLPNRNTMDGRRDLSLISFMFETGARVQEVCDTKVRDLRLDGIAHVVLTGKGKKTRQVPVVKPFTQLMRQYLRDNGLNHQRYYDNFLFFNRIGNKLTRAGVAYILTKYFIIAKEKDPTMPSSISPHKIRHSKAVSLLENGVNLVYIRDFLGHSTIQTTEIYARVTGKLKEEALLGASTMIVEENLLKVKPKRSNELITLLNSIGR